MAIRKFSRRSFLRGLGLATGLSLGLFRDEAEAAETTATTVKTGFDPNVFVHISESGDTTIVCHRSEMGQGVRSTFVYLFADELGADPARVKLVQADGDKAYGDQNTDGSSSIRKRYEELRTFAATTREALVSAAAAKLGVARTELVADKSEIRHDASDRKLGFGELAVAAAKAPLPKPDAVTLKPKSELRFIGKQQPFFDGPAIAMGTAQYGADVLLDDLHIAVIARPPVVGSAVVRVDDSAARQIPGVVDVVTMKTPSAPYRFQVWGGVAVIAKNTWAAMRGRAALTIEWAPSPNDGYDSEAFRASMKAAVGNPGEVRRDVGDAEAALKSASSTLEADYYVPHLPHAPMEPPVATARFANGTLEVWAPTQNPQTATAAAAEAAGLDEKDVVVHVTFLGGGFGRKSKGDFVSEAAYLAHTTGLPIRVQWSREDDLQHDYLNTVSYQRYTAGLDENGRVVAWRHRTAFPPIASTFNASADTPSAGDLQQGVLDLALDVPNVRAEAVSAKAHARIGWLRSVYNIFHAFGTGSFVDELAHHQERDVRTTLLELIGAPRTWSLEDLGIESLSNYGADLAEHPVDAGRLANVVERVTEQSRWQKQRASGRSLGLAAHRSFLAYTAVVAAIRKRDGAPALVDEVWISIDAGTVVNPERAVSQMEGSVLFGLNLALFGGVTFKEGRAEQSTFHDLRLVRIGDAPRNIHVDIVQSDAAPAGIGEPGVPPVAPAIANAFFALTGTRVRELPMAKAFGYDR